MEARVRKINHALRWFDKNLFARLDSDKINIYLKGTRFLPYSFENGTLLYSLPNPKYICSLTDDWSLKGTPREWGIEPLFARLRSIDSWNRPDFCESLIDGYAKEKEASLRRRKNEDESFLIEHRNSFKKAFSDINVSNLEKIDPRRNKDGYC